MIGDPAPLHEDVADAPPGGAAFWLHTSDGVRIRAAYWLPVAGSDGSGTVFLFPGRTEYIEKYGEAAGAFTARSFATLVVDWRGQGLADRALADRMVGHVARFSDYQFDVAALSDLARERALPKPWFLLAHSMGGCIALRSLMKPQPFSAAVFTGPMWGLKIAPWMRPVATIYANAARLIGLGHLYAPGSGPRNYVQDFPHVGNILTTDAERYDMMQRQIAAHPDLALGGPSLHWAAEALAETRSLRRMKSPPTPALTFAGSNERVVATHPIAERMARWPGGRIEWIDGAEHEVLMESPDTRHRIHDRAAAFYRSARR